MSIRKLIEAGIYRSGGQITGQIVSPIRELWDDAQGMVFCADVDIGQDEILRNVPIATSNRDIYYSDQGKSVSLEKMNNSKWVITGLSKNSKGLTHYIYMSFMDDIAKVTSTAWVGATIRPLTFGELGSLAPLGFGQFPWGAVGRFDVEGNFIGLVGG
jgi:hypothetical protein